MRTAAVALVLALFGLAASDSALARKVTPPGASAGGGGGHGGGRHGHRHHSTFVGVGFGWSSWWYPPYYYPVPVAVPVHPVTYIEQGVAEPAWWYYCDAASAYYPHVRTCPAGWQRVPPAPPPQ